MTTRDFAFVALKLTGLLYLVDSIFTVVNMVILLSASPSEAWPAPPRSFGASSLASVVIYSGLAFVCLFLTNRVVWLLFDEDEAPTVPADNPRRLLTVGVVLIGVYLFASDLAASFRFLAELLIAQEPRYDDVGEGFRDVFLHSPDWRDGIVSIGSAIVGIILMFRGKWIASILSKQFDLAESASTKGL